MAGWLSCHTFPTSPQSLAPPEAKIVEAVTPGQILTIEPMGFADKCSVRKKKRWIKDDAKIFRLGNWKHGVAVY